MIKLPRGGCKPKAQGSYYSYLPIRRVKPWLRTRMSEDIYSFRARIYTLLIYYRYLHDATWYMTCVCAFALFKLLPIDRIYPVHYAYTYYIPNAPWNCGTTLWRRSCTHRQTARSTSGPATTLAPRTRPRARIEALRISLRSRLVAGDLGTWLCVSVRTINWPRATERPVRPFVRPISIITQCRYILRYITIIIDCTRTHRYTLVFFFFHLYSFVGIEIWNKGICGIVYGRR